MKTSFKLGALPRLGLAAALASVVAAAGAASPHGLDRKNLQGVGAEKLLHETGTSASKSIEVNERGIYIVGLRSAPLAMYSGTDARFEAIPRLENGKLDLKADVAERYLQALDAEQDVFLNRVSGRVGRAVAPMAPKFRFQHAFNGFVLQLSPEELEIVAADPEVALIEGYREYQLNTDVGPGFIGAPAIWEGVATPNGFRSRGEGIVIGVIDSGANLGSPSFTATDMEGYTHVNPLGEGNYLGWCNPTNPNHDPARDVCNGKVIGGWDFSDNQITGTNREARGFEDDNGHGSHTASTAGGNIRMASVGAANVIIEGVAPRANLVIFDACYTNAAGDGLCGNDATLGSINQAVADGVVDVINYSISGGTSPWLEANSLAFLAASNAGIFISASAGNSGPGASTVAHNEPWVTTVAASTHTRVAFGNAFSVTGPGAPPANLTGIGTRPGVNPPLVNTFPLENVPLVISPTFATPSTDGCSPFAPGTFTRQASSGDAIFASGFEAGEEPAGPVGAIALVRWPGPNSAPSACGTAARANAAALAGARAVLFMPEPSVNLNSAGGANAPVFVVYDFDVQTDLIDWINDNVETATGSINEDQEAFNDPTAGDVMADFSSRGPNNLTFLKPDVTAPGVAILAAVARWDTSTAPGTLVPGLNDVVGLLQGTSMSSPHNAGAGALIKAVNRSWTPSEIKSALMTTSIQAVRKEDAATPADPFDYGAGRIDLNKAANAGFVMNETGANFSAANPANGGDPSQLNIASFQRPSCTGICTFNRTVRGTRNGVTWTATIEGLPDGSATVTPATIAPTTTSSTAFALNVDSAELPPDVWTFGQVVWTPSNPAVPVARMPIAIRAAGPGLQIPQNAINALANPGATTTAQITVNNVGNPTLDWAIASGSLPVTFIDQGPQLGNGFRGSEHASSETATSYAADDFDLPAAGTVNFLQSNGFILPAAASLATSTAIKFRIYADDNGVPAGAPRNNGTNVGAAPLWEASVLPNAVGVSIAAGGVVGNISLDVNAAGLIPAVLPAGKYWMVVTPTLPGSGANNAANPLWAAAIVGVGSPVNGLAPRIRTSTVTATWGVPSLTGAPGPGPASGFSMTSRGTVECGAPWLSASPASGSLGLTGSTNVTVTFDATGLTPGVYRAALCVSSNAGNKALPVTLTVPTIDPNAGIEKAFVPASVSTVAVSRLTVTLSNTTGGVMTTTAPLVDSFPSGLVVASTPNATTTCASGTVTAVAGSGQVELAAGAQIPAISSCTMSVNVRSGTIGSYENIIPVGALQTSSAAGIGNSQTAATATLAVVAPVFPEPYCPINFTVSVDPISLVRFAGIDNPSPSATGTPPALSNFLSIEGTVTRDTSLPITVKGNTDGAFPYQVIAYIDWNQNGVYEASEATTVGVITGSDGADAQEAVGSIAIPPSALTGNTRMRVVFQNPAVSGPCAGGGFGSAEEYTIVVN